MAEPAVRDDVERRGATRPDPGLRVRRFGPWVGIGLVGSVLRPGTSTPTARPKGPAAPPDDEASPSPPPSEYAERSNSH